MKTIALNRLPGQPIARPLNVELIADSALNLMRNPVFVPDIAQQWQACIYPAFRVSRLGKSISTEFTARYIDATTLALRIFSPELGGVQAGVSGLYDCAVTLGQWIEIPEQGTIDITCGDIRATLSASQIAAAEMLNAVSAMATMKTGDIILPCHLDVELPVAINTHISAEIGGNEVLKVKFK